LRTRILTFFLAALVAVGISGTGTIASAGTTGGDKVVKIAVLAPLKAGLVEFGAGIKNSVQLAVDQANKKHAIPGWKIEVLAVDDSSDGPTGAAGAATIVADPDVVGVVGTYNSGVALQAAPVFQPAHLAMISPSNTLSSLTLGDDSANPTRQFDDYFRMVASDARQGPFLARAVLKMGVRHVAVVSETKAVSKGLADAFTATFKDRGGTVNVQQVVPDGSQNFKDFLDAVATDKPDMIFFGGEYQVAAVLRNQATASGFTKPLVGGDGIKDDAYIKDAGQNASGTVASTVGVPSNLLKSAKGYLKAYDKAGFSEPPTDYGPYAYDAANLLIDAARKVLKGQDSIPTDARQKIVSLVQKANTTGVSGPISFNAFGDTRHMVFTLYKVTGNPLAWKPVKT